MHGSGYRSRWAAAEFRLLILKGLRSHNHDAGFGTSGETPVAVQEAAPLQLPHNHIIPQRGKKGLEAEKV